MTQEVVAQASARVCGCGKARRTLKAVYCAARFEAIRIDAAVPSPLRWTLTAPVHLLPMSPQATSAQKEGTQGRQEQARSEDQPRRLGARRFMPIHEGDGTLAHSACEE